MKKIPMVDLTAQYKEIKDELAARIDEILASGRYILGPNVEAFEREAASYIGTRHAVSVASGTEALHLALLAAGIGPGDEVITTPFTFIATAEAISYTGARPVFVDVDRRTFNMDPAGLDAALTDRTKAILPVHLFGHPADMGMVLEFAVTHGVAVIEDCAQSFGAHYKLARTGAFADAGCFSFFPSKNLGCFGDGGMVTTDSDRLNAKLRLLRNHGSSGRYVHETIGYNSRLDELQAGILRVKLKRVDTCNKKRRMVAGWYTGLLAGVDGIKTPAELEGYFHVYHQYTILAKDRGSLAAGLQAAGIASAAYYPVPLHLQEAYRGLGYKEGDFPVAERLAGEVLSLPIYPELEKGEVERICRAVLASRQG